MNILKLISEMPDPRMKGKVVYKFSAIVFVVLCGILSGCESWSDIEDYCEAKKEWLGQYVDLKSGIPSKWTFRRVFTLLNPDHIELLLRDDAKEIVARKNPIDQIAVDGKTLRRSGRQDMQCLQSVRAWCHENGLVLAEQEVDVRSHETKTIPMLLEHIDIKGNTISIDAAGYQKPVTKIIVAKKGYYVLGLKRNHPKLYSAIEETVRRNGMSSSNLLHDEFDEGHARLVRRRYFGYDISALPELEGFVGAKSVVAVETISSKDNDSTRGISTRWRYY